MFHAGKKRIDSWEDLCKQCGLCCFERIRVAGGVRIDLSRPCSYLDVSSRRCTVYEKRFKTKAFCAKVNVFHALFGRRMPLTCGYVEHYRR